MHRPVHTNPAAHSIFTVVRLFQTFAWNWEMDLCISSILHLLFKICSSWSSGPSQWVLTSHGLWPLNGWEWHRLSSIWWRTWLAPASSKSAKYNDKDFPRANTTFLLLAPDTGWTIWLGISFKTSILFLYFILSLFLVFLWKKTVFSLEGLRSFWPEMEIITHVK